MNRVLGLVAVVCSTGCLAFSSLEEPQGGQQGGEITLQTTCNGIEPTLIRSSGESIQASTASLGSDIESVPACGLETSGPDGFFMIDVEPGQRWHVEAAAADRSADVSLFALRTCDERTCDVGANKCPAGEAERMNLIAEEFGSRFIGINTSVASDVTIVANQVFCGDGILQLGETCDDGNDDDTDNCGHQCRRIISNGGSEFEPNDDVLEENYMTWDASSRSAVVGGTLRGACDLDRYAIEVPADVTLRASLLELGQQDCTDENPNLELRFLDPFNPVTQTVIGEATAENTCPVLQEQPIMMNLVAGEYHFVVRRPSTETSNMLTYLLKVEQI